MRAQPSASPAWRAIAASRACSAIGGEIREMPATSQTWPAGAGGYAW